eukprot:460425-Prorocentrum_minimum.AAC.1
MCIRDSDLRIHANESWSKLYESAHITETPSSAFQVDVLNCNQPSHIMGAVLTRGINGRAFSACDGLIRRSQGDEVRMRQMLVVAMVVMVMVMVLVLVGDLQDGEHRDHQDQCQEGCTLQHGSYKPLKRYTGGILCSSDGVSVLDGAFKTGHRGWERSLLPQRVQELNARLADRYVKSRTARTDRSKKYGSTV